MFEMVSTRGVKFKFTEGERVLCYEPDPTKAKVLYDSKVLEVIVSKESRGRKSVQYLIHFQGWNSSWDRCVAEDYVLKDTDENRQLQKDLAQRAQLQFGAYLYRRERKKHNKRLSDKINESLEQKDEEKETSSEDDGDSSLQDSDGDSDRDQETVTSADSSPEEEEGEDIDRGAIRLSDKMKKILEDDNERITVKHKVVKLPADPNVVKILEGYVKHCAVNQLCGMTEKPQRRYRIIPSKTKDMEAIVRNLNLTKEVVDGLRIYLDFTLSDHLLYTEEQSQFEQFKNCSPLLIIKQEQLENDDLEEISKSIRIHDTHNDRRSGDFSDGSPSDRKKSDSKHNEMQEHYGEQSRKRSEPNEPNEGDRKRSLRSHKSGVEEIAVPVSNGIKNPQTSQAQQVEVKSNLEVPVSSNEHFNSITSTNTSSRCSTPTLGNTQTITSSSSPRSNTLLSQVLSWQMVPDSLYSQKPVPPSLVYGAIHLARLFVKLPDQLYSTSMPDKKMKVLLQHLEKFLHYLEEHSEWFEESAYKDNF